MFLVDSHCHLHMDPIASDLPNVLARAEANEVKLLQTVCTKKSDVELILPIVLSHDHIFGSIGVHPNALSESEVLSADEILQLCSLSLKLNSIGETGLDYAGSNFDAKLQRKSFLAHIEAAQRSGFPLIIHSRSADIDTSDLLIQESKNAPFKAVLHCFTGGEELARTALNLGLFISISGIVTFSKATHLQELVSSFIPTSNLLLETDSPYLAPVPFRGKPNEPAFVLYTARKVALLKNMEVEALCSATSANFITLFSIPAGSIARS